MANTCDTCGCVLECPICEHFSNANLVDDVDRLNQLLSESREQVRRLSSANNNTHTRENETMTTAQRTCKQQLAQAKALLIQMQSMIDAPLDDAVQWGHVGNLDEALIHLEEAVTWIRGATCSS